MVVSTYIFAAVAVPASNEYSQEMVLPSRKEVHEEWPKFVLGTKADYAEYL